jgi:hypothetical protein
MDEASVKETLQVGEFRRLAKKPAKSAEAPATDLAADAKRVNVIFSAQQYQTLSELAAQQGTNISDALRRAINIAKVVVEADQDGKILIQRRNGEMQQLKLIY